MQDTIDAQFTTGYNEVHRLYEENDLEGCIAKAEELLDEPAIPRFHRMKTLILLGNVLGDWNEAEDCRVRAEAIWRVVRRWHPEGADEEVDTAMQELRVSLDDLHEVLREEAPQEYAPELSIQDLVDANDREVAAARAVAQATEDDPEELARVEPKVLAQMDQDMAALEISARKVPQPDVGHTIGKMGSVKQSHNVDLPVSTPQKGPTSDASEMKEQRESKDEDEDMTTHTAMVGVGESHEFMF
ncbi:hypothetical protein LTR17_008955 [Elasticomyces elasticus]|nr:hypothetical protein LTR17_008955 [Elasticomyces elasticus]